MATNVNVFSQTFLLCRMTFIHILEVRVVQDFWGNIDLMQFVDNSN